MTLKWRFCDGDSPAVSADEGRVKVATVGPDDPREGRVEIDIADPARFVARSGVNHSVFISEVDFSDFVTDITVTEKLDTDTEVVITLTNHELRMEHAFSEALKEGELVRVELFDGIQWSDFGGGAMNKPPKKGETATKGGGTAKLVVAEVERDYGLGSTIRLTCRSKQFRLQYREKAHRWEKKRDSDIVIELAVAFGLIPNVKETPIIRDETVQPKEPVSMFLNRLAKRNQYEWRIEGDELYFRPLEGEKTDITLYYRPGGQYLENYANMGTILSASARRETDSKKGKGGKADMPATDLAAGTIDPDTLASLQNGNEGGILPNEDVEAANRTGIEEDEVQGDLSDEALPSGEGGYVTFDRNKGDGFKKVYEVSDPSLKTDGTAEEARANAAGLENANAYERVLELETYGMVDLRLRRIITVEGLGPRDDGKWLIASAVHSYSASKAYRVKLGTVSNLKKGDLSASTGAATADGKNTVDVRKEGVVRFDRARGNGFVKEYRVTQ